MEMKVITSKVDGTSVSFDVSLNTIGLRVVHDRMQQVLGVFSSIWLL